MPKVPLPGHDDGRFGVVDLLQHARNVLHDALEALRHVVQRAVGVHHRVFEQADRDRVGAAGQASVWLFCVDPLVIGNGLSMRERKDHEPSWKTSGG
jgi:hypothetical protein